MCCMRNLKKNSCYIYIITTIKAKKYDSRRCSQDFVHEKAFINMALCVKYSQMVGFQTSRNEQIRKKTKNKLMSVISPVQSHDHEGSPMG